MANNEDAERTDESDTDRAESASEDASGRAGPTDQADVGVTDVPPREELKQSFDRHQLMRRHIDQSLDTMLRLNPVENILKNIDQESAVYDQVEGQVETMMNEWLDMYRDTLEEGRTLPADLIGRSAELARESRENPRERPEERSRRR
jgi:histone H3/H4